MKIGYLYLTKKHLRDKFISKLSFEVCLTKIISNDYDLLFFDEPSLCNYILDKNKFQIPLIYCALEEEKPIQLIPSLHRIVTFSPFKPLNPWGFPENLFINYFPLPEIEPSTISKNNQQKRILHIPSSNDYNLYATRNIIRFFNQHSSFQLTIHYFGDKEELEYICNPNIQINNGKTDHNIKWEDYDIFIGSEDYAVEAIFQKKPVIIVGKRGMGGLVVPENINSFFRYRFEGRNGGELQEYIPERILNAEIQHIETINIENILNENYYLLHKILPHHLSAPFLMLEIQKIIQLNRNILSNQYNNIYPSLQKHIQFIHSDHNSFIINTLTGNFMGELENDAIEWLNEMKGNTPLSDLLNTIRIEEKEEGIAFIKELWDKKIIILN